MRVAADPPDDIARRARPAQAAQVASNLRSPLGGQQELYSPQQLFGSLSQQSGVTLHEECCVGTLLAR